MTEVEKSAAIWATVALAFSIFALVFNNSAMVMEAGFLMKALACLAGTFLGWVGAMIGDAIRRFAMPDGFFTTGGMGEMIKFKVFWAIGPQSIGLLIGSVVAITLVLR